MGEAEAKAADEDFVASMEAVESEPEDQNDDALPKGDGEDQDGEEGPQDAADEESEIVLTGEAGSQPDDEHRGIRKRINKLNKKVEAAQEGESEAVQKVRILEERVKLLQLAHDQGGKPEAKAPPDPLDFDDGANDPKYVSALQAYIKEDVVNELKQSLPKDQPQPKRQSTPDLEEKQVRHYQRADKLKVRDYDATEDKAIEILGQEVVKQVIAGTDKSAEILYYLGKNPSQAETIKELIETNPVQGVLKIGALEARLQVRPKAQTKPAPDPDTELEGGSSPKSNDYERKLDKLREKATSGSHADMQALLTFKKEHKAKTDRA